VIVINVKADIASASKFFRELNKDAIDRASVNTLNVVARTARNEALDQISRVRNIKRSLIRLAVGLVRARKWELRAEVTARGRPIPLRDYDAKQVAAGVRVKVMQERKIIPGAFIVDRLGGHVFERFGERVNRKTAGGRKILAQKIRKLFGPSIPTAFLRQTTQLALRAVIARDFRRVMNEKLEEQLRKLRAKYGSA